MVGSQPTSVDCCKLCAVGGNTVVGSQPNSVDCCKLCAVGGRQPAHLCGLLQVEVAHVDAPLNLGSPDGAAFVIESKESAYELAREASRHNPELKVPSLPLSGLFGDGCENDAHHQAWLHPLNLCSPTTGECIQIGARSRRNLELKVPSLPLSGLVTAARQQLRHAACGQHKACSTRPPA